MRFVVLSDTHVDEDPQAAYNDVKPNPPLREAVRRINAMRPAPQEAVVLGDLARNATEGDYKVYLAIISGLKVKTVRHLLGNHDKYPEFRKIILKDLTGPAPGGWPPPTYCRAWDFGADWRMISLDTRRGGQVIGEVGKGQLAWLEAQLKAAAGKNVLVFMHHHPTVSSDDGIVSSAQFLAVVDRHANIRAIFCGHRHVLAFERHKKVHIVSVPATSWAFRPSDPRGYLIVTPGKGSLTVEFAPLGQAGGAKRLTKKLSWQ